MVCSGKRVRHDRAQIPRLKFAHVCLVLPDKAVAVLTRELLYTGITRAKTRLTLVLPQIDVLWRAVDAKVIRSGGLGA